jgi:hypothetical protein
MARRDLAKALRHADREWKTQTVKPNRVIGLTTEHEIT